MADYTTVGLLANIRRRAMLPATTATGTADADLLALANDELALNIAASLLAVREEYFNTYTDTTISGAEYRIPSRAIAQTLRLVQLRDANGNEKNLTRIQPQQAEQWSGATADPFAYYVRGSTIVLVPFGSTSFTTLRMMFPRRPSELTATGTDFGTITAINTTTGVVSFSGSGSFSTGTPLVDFVSGTPGFDVKAADISATGAAGTVTVAASSLPASLAIGDYVCHAGKSPVPTVPMEHHAILAILTAIDVCVALGDGETAETLAGELAKAEASVKGVLTSPRTPGAPQKAVARFNALSVGRRGQ